MLGFDANNSTNEFSNTANSFGKFKLWKDSQTTLKYVSPLLSFSKEKRFRWASIYWPEDNASNLLIKKKRKSETHEIATKISKLIDEEEKNEDRIKKIKRSFEITKSQVGSSWKESHSTQSARKPFKLSKENEKVLVRLLPLEMRKQSTLRDRHGNRCNLIEDPQAQETNTDIGKCLGTTTGFRTSRRIKLQLPHNYYPGPGTYQIKRYLSQLDQKSIQQPRNKLQAIDNI